jgi:hypothetical protein
LRETTDNNVPSDVVEITKCAGMQTVVHFVSAVRGFRKQEVVHAGLISLIQPPMPEAHAG